MDFEVDTFLEFLDGLDSSLYVNFGLSSDMGYETYDMTVKELAEDPHFIQGDVILERIYSVSRTGKEKTVYSCYTSENRFSEVHRERINAWGRDY